MSLGDIVTNDVPFTSAIAALTIAPKGPAGNPDPTEESKP